MRPPPKSRGKRDLADATAGAVRPFNEAPAEKQGKTARPFRCCSPALRPFNEAPAEKQGKTAAREAAADLAERLQ